jgi:hypothetical protein
MNTKSNEEWDKQVNELVDNLKRNVDDDSEWRKNNPPDYEKNRQGYEKDQKTKSSQRFTWMLILVLVLVVLIWSFSKDVKSQITNFDNSPLNMKNSPFNFENSPLNMRNSPYNIDNSPNNLDSKNGVYDNQGNRTGYKVTSPEGVTNYFDNKGNRTGYTPSQR